RAGGCKRHLVRTLAQLRSPVRRGHTFGRTVCPLSLAGSPSPPTVLLRTLDVRLRRNAVETNRPRGRRRFARCINCGKELPVRKGPRPTDCPTCGAVQKWEYKAPTSPRIPTHEFYGARLVGTIVGGVLFIPLGAFLAAVVYPDTDLGTRLLLMAVYA